MPQTKRKPARFARPVQNGPPEVFTLAEAAAYLRLPEEELPRLVREQDLHARQVGADWRFLKSAIEDWLRTGPQPLSPQQAKARLLELIREHPLEDGDEFRAEIERQREIMEREIRRRQRS